MGRREWIKDEETYMYRRYLYQSVETTAKFLNRSVSSVKHKARKLGLNHYCGECLAAKTIAKAFNCDVSVVIRWIEKLELPCKKFKVSNSTRYLIDPDNFWEWAKNHKTEINWRKYEAGSILPEPDWMCSIKNSYIPERHRNKITPEERRRIKVLMKQNKGNVEIAKEIGRTYYATVHITSNIYK